MKTDEELTYLNNLAENIWVPNWYKWFTDHKFGGFHERLDENHTSLKLPKRLLSQCRQVITYSQHPDLKYKLDNSFQYIIDHYHNTKTGGSIFSIGTDNKPVDKTYDLYAQAFVILACANYYDTTKSPFALGYAKNTLRFIKTYMKAPNNVGYIEAVDEKLQHVPGRIRRQNPHMHLFEAFMSMYQASQDQDYLHAAHEMKDLFFDYFFDDDTGTLGEFYDDELQLHFTEGNKIEAGHHAEWAWLLDTYQKTFKLEDTKINNTIDSLYNWVLNYGIDEEFGGFYNQQDKKGHIYNKDKRIWPVFEILRASQIESLRSELKHESEDLKANCLHLIVNNYMNIKTGDWNEVLTNNLRKKSDFLPATTPYHIYMALKESNTKYE